MYVCLLLNKKLCSFNKKKKYTVRKFNAMMELMLLEMLDETS